MIRVIAGTAGGLKLKTLDSEDTRPTLDRVKEAMFSILAPYLRGTAVLDLFAGSGALGIEALSRGADHCRFNDGSRKCVDIIKQNIAHTSFAEKAEVTCETYGKAIERLGREGVKFDVVLLDPPYGANYYEDAILNAERYGLFAGNCVIMCEHRSDMPLPDAIGGVEAFKRKEYGTVGLTFYKKGDDEIDH
ncbi:MAG: 16S rRNA (guanine(966)-N(2))-methyltransferase RsmD [Clostridia bacterium]|nr:16S rRNA (guanine(966)-N(2))-methyltransferase RsmD [Clostridia bacterium]